MFGGGAETSLQMQVNEIVEQVTSNLGSLGIWEMSVPVSHQAEALMDTLKNKGWLQDNNESMKTENVDKFIQLLLCMLQAQPKVRDAALTLELKPTDDIGHFITKMETNMRQGKRESTVAVASTPSSTDPIPSYAAAVAKKQMVTRDYCHKVGHTSKKCLKRKKEQRTNTSTKDDWTNKPSSGGVTPSVRPTTTPKMSNVPDASGKSNSMHSHYCALHGHQNTHTTDRCYSLQKMRKEHESKRFSGGKPSGEAARPGAQNPG